MPSNSQHHIVSSRKLTTFSPLIEFFFGVWIYGKEYALLRNLGDIICGRYHWCSIQSPQISSIVSMFWSPIFTVFCVTSTIYFWRPPLAHCVACMYRRWIAYNLLCLLKLSYWLAIKTQLSSLKQGQILRYNLCSRAAFSSSHGIRLQMGLCLNLHLFEFLSVLLPTLP